MPKTTPATTAAQARHRFQAAHLCLRFHRRAYRLAVAAEALDVEPNRVLATLMVEVDGSPVCVVVPADSEVSMKKLAAAMDAKAAKMMQPSDAERITGLTMSAASARSGKRKKVPVAIDRTGA